MNKISLAFVALAFIECAPPPDLDPSRIDAPRLLAVRMDPPQAIPGTTDVMFTALLAMPDATSPSGSTDWAWCLDPRLPTDTTNIPARCSMSSGQLVAFGNGVLSAHAIVPSNVCSIVGPTLPPVGPDAHPQRVPDPDSTGGYSVPARVTWTGETAFDTAFARVRIDCPRADVPSDVAFAYASLSQPNHNPTIARIDRLDANGLAVPVLPSDIVASGDRITLSLTVTPDSTESFVRISVDGRSVEQDNERLDVSWFAAGASFDSNRTVMTQASTHNVLNVSAAAASWLTVWAIVRDGRGGTDWQTFRWQVR